MFQRVLGPVHINAALCERDRYEWAREWKAGQLGAKGLQTLDFPRVAESEMPVVTDRLLWVSMASVRSEAALFDKQEKRCRRQ